MMTADDNLNRLGAPGAGVRQGEPGVPAGAPRPGPRGARLAGGPRAGRGARGGACGAGRGVTNGPEPPAEEMALPEIDLTWKRLSRRCGSGSLAPRGGCPFLAHPLQPSCFCALKNCVPKFLAKGRYANRSIFH